MDEEIALELRESVFASQFMDLFEDKDNIKTN